MLLGFCWFADDLRRHRFCNCVERHFFGDIDFISCWKKISRSVCKNNEGYQTEIQRGLANFLSVCL